MIRLGLVLLLASLASCTRTPLPDVSLSFERDGRIVRRVSLAELVSRIDPVDVTTDDPYYGKRKRFRALPLEAVLEQGFQLPHERLKTLGYVLRASDGYAVPTTGERLFAGGAYLAFDDLDASGFEPMGPRRINPGPFYLVWTAPRQRAIERYPQPWQLQTISVARFEDLYSHVIPHGEPAGSPASRGFEIVRARCLRCHAINREGGRVGPDLNVPKSVVEYWSDDQIREYVRDPGTFRYGAMPSHKDLSNADLDAIVAYLHAMASRKYDGGGGRR